MPLTTHMGFMINPDIFINVSDGGGGGGNDHTVDLTVAYDPAVLNFIGGSDGCADLGGGTCGWFDVLCPADGRTFTVDFSRRTTAATTVTVVSVDEASGEGDFDSISLPRAGRTLNLTVSAQLTGTGKKAGKKARRKA